MRFYRNSWNNLFVIKWVVCTCLCRKFTQSNLSSEGISAENTHYALTHNTVLCTGENVRTAVKSLLPQLHCGPGYQLLQRQLKTWLAVALSNLMSMSGGRIRLAEAISPLRKSAWRQNLWHGTIRRSLLEESIVLIELKFRQWGTGQGQSSLGPSQSGKEIQ